jgi:hypothetical protein
MIFGKAKGWSEDKERRVCLYSNINAIVLT